LHVKLNKALRKDFLTGHWQSNSKVAYAAEDTLATFQLVPITRRLLRESRQEEIWEKYERPLISVIAKMELGGVDVDQKKIAALRMHYQQEVKEAQAAFQQSAGAINPRSRT